MNPQQLLIKKILQAKSAAQVFETADIKSEYREMLLLIHPDKCKLPDAGEAVDKLHNFYTEVTKGKAYSDGVFDYNYTATEIAISGSLDLQKASFRNYRLLQQVNNKMFLDTLPAGMEFVGDKLVCKLTERAIPLSACGTLPVEHVNWITSRMLEFASWIQRAGYVHGGINPDSIYVLPRIHRIIVLSFCYMTPTGAVMKSISGKYKSFYPASLFTDKIATTAIDVALLKRTAITLLGDSSGDGVALRKTINPAIIDFLVRSHAEASTAYFEFRELLAEHFEKKFYVLEV